MLGNGQKQYHDRYHIYVNDDFVGNKVLLTGNDSISDVENYLRGIGFEDFITDLEGDNYLIHSKNSLDSAKMKTILGGYLNIR